MNQDNPASTSGGVLSRIRSRSDSTNQTAGAQLGRTSTRESNHSGDGPAASVHLAGLLNHTKGLFGKKRGSVSSSEPIVAPASPRSPQSAADPPLSSFPSARASALPPPALPDKSTARPVAANSDTSAGAMTTRTPSEAAVGKRREELSDISSNSNGSAGRPAESYRSTGLAITRDSPFQPGTPDTTPATGASSVPTQSTQSQYAAQSAAATQARLKTLPRLESYKRNTIPENELTPIDSGHGASGYETGTSLSGTETEQDTETETETEEDEEGEGDDDFEDREHDEHDARGGAAGMQRNLQRPALPTLASTRGFSKASTPFQTASAHPQPNPFAFSGWTTFGMVTPTATPGPLRTARPMPGDNAPNGSYFDVRPTSGTSSSARTPAQTPRPPSAAGDPNSARFSRSPIQPLSGAGASPSPQPARIRVESRASSQAAPISRQTAAIPAVQPAAVNGSPVTGTATVNQSQPSPTPSSRPSFYHRQSRSLVDLSRSLDDDNAIQPTWLEQVQPPSRPLSRPTSSHGRPMSSGGRSVGSSSGPGAGPSSSSVIEAVPEEPHTLEEAEKASASPAAPTLADNASQVNGESAARPIQRRQSMPEMRIDPPVYSIDDDFFIQYKKGQAAVVQREEEGREPLPAYSCDVHIEGYVPRKMEFLKPGVQAKDRRWKRQYVILHGTSIKVYKTDPRAKPVAGEGAPPSPGIHKADQKPDFRSAGSKTAASSGSAFRHRSQTDASMSSMSSATSGDSEKSLAWNRAAQTAASRRTFDPDVPVHVHLQEDEETGLASLQHPGVLLAKASENRCIRHYTLQGAESGLAADYLKRRHVVRVRAEGEQFLIQARDDRNVIDWIEALQAATNTSLDLDVRPLPKFITLPRRRRRRPRPADPSAPAGGASATATGANGTTSTPPNGNSQVNARSDAMNNMLAEDQEAYMRTPGGLVG